MFTKAEATALMRDMLDDPNAVRWSTTQLANFTTAVLDSLWRRILQVRPEYLVATQTVAVDATGIIDLSEGGDLTSGRIHGIRSIVRDNQEYEETSWRNVVLEGGEAVVYPSQTWAKLGDSLYLFPLEAGNVDIRYSYLPPRFNSLASGASVQWPEGHELAYILRVPGLLLLKGVVEDSSMLMAEARQAFREMLETLPKQSPGATQMLTEDTPEGWGG